jgi:hypothetical protein
MHMPMVAGSSVVSATIPSFALCLDCRDSLAEARMTAKHHSNGIKSSLKRKSQTDDGTEVKELKLKQINVKAKCMKCD